jgi:hypothetical protein
MEKFILLLLVHLVLSTPQVGFLFNSQIPDVARVNRSYEFMLSPSTFRSAGSNTVITLENAPSWLQVNTTTNTLYGTPSGGDTGNTTFKIVATDSTGSTSMPASLVVDGGQGPIIGSNVTDVLIKAGILTGTTSIILSPLSNFGIEFAPVFTPIDRNLLAYITMRDHTPVPAWINFDAATFRVSGITPRVDANPQNMELDIIASETPGFASARVSITISVSTHQFFFGSVDTIANIPAGENVNISTLKGRLQFDGHPISDTDFMSATAQVPNWLTFDAQNLFLTGTPPPGIGVENITVTAYDKYGDTASMILRLNLGFGKLYKGHIGTLNATAGKEFIYQMSQADFIGDDLDIQVDMGVASNWLQFDFDKLLIRGTIPESAASQTVSANLTVMNREKGLRDFQEFGMQICKWSLKTKVNHEQESLIQL